MKTSPITLTLALLVSAPALAQNGSFAPQERNWYDCYMGFHTMHKRNIEDMGNLAQAIKNGSVEVDPQKVICALAQTNAFMKGAGEACIKLGDYVPKNSPNKKFITQTDKELRTQLKTFQKLAKRDMHVCVELQEAAQKAQEEAAQKAQKEKEAAQKDVKDKDKMRQEPLY